MVYMEARRKRRRIKSIVWFVIFITALLLLITLTCFELRLRPLVVNTSKNFARLFASDIISESVDEAFASTIEKNNIKLVNVVYGDSGVDSIETNVIAVSRLRSESVKNISSRIKDAKSMTLKVPFGNLIGSSLLTGRGFPIPIRLVPIGDVYAELYSEFIEAGINQTLHRIYIRIRITMNMLVATDTTKLEMSNDILVSETVIVGKVPDAYTAINRFEIDEDEENDLNDYAATLP